MASGLTGSHTIEMKEDSGMGVYRRKEKNGKDGPYVQWR